MLCQSIIEYDPTSGHNTTVNEDQMNQTKTSKKTEKSTATRQRMIEAATKLFAASGYAQTSLSEVINAANVTTGAVYYHFGDKKSLFQAVAEFLEQEILDEVSARVSAIEHPWEAFETGILETLEVCARPDIQRIVFREAPAVIGLREWRDIEVKYSFGMMQTMVAQMSEAGLLITREPVVTSQIILGALIEAAHSIAESDDQDSSILAAKQTLRLMINSLKAPVQSKRKK